jgi:glycosyltransferase involved in cell wall biosynthesis
VSTACKAPWLPTVEDYRSRPPHPERVTGGRRVEAETIRGEGIVTVITVSFNSARTIDRTIDSIKAQTYSNVEYIVIDGGSEDGTVDILRRRNREIDLWISERDQGISDAFNKGVALASGEYVAMLNSDDWLEPDHLRIAVTVLQQPHIDFVFGDLLLHAPNGRQEHCFLGEPDYGARIAHYMPFINHPTVVCRRATFSRIGLFDPLLRTAMDYDWFLRLHKIGGLGCYSPRLTGHMTLEGQSDRYFMLGLREVREISIRHGYPEWLAWGRYAFRLAKGKLRRRLRTWLPPVIYESLRKRINVNYRSGNDHSN